MPTILLNKIKPGGKTLTNLRVGSTEVKYVKRGDGKLFYDTLSYYSYGTPSVSLSYPSGNTPYSGGTKSPTLTYLLSKTPVGYSGTNYTASTLNSGASSIKYEVTSGAATVNASTGVVTWGANTSTSTRSATIKVTVTVNSKSNSATATVTLDANTSAGTYSQSWKFSVFNVTNYLYSFGFKFTNAEGNSMTVTGGGGSGGTSNPSREGTSYINKNNTSLFRPNGFYFTDMSSIYSNANNSSGYYQDGTTGKYYYVRWSYGTAPTTSNYKTHGYKFYSGIVESWTYSASTLYVWVYQS